MAVEHLWRELDSRGLISVGEYSGYYSTPDEQFVPLNDVLKHPDRFVRKRARARTARAIANVNGQRQPICAP